MNTKIEKQPSLAMSLVPLVVLVIFLALTIKLFGGDAIAGGSQLSLITASAVCTAMAMGIYRRKWQQLEDAVVNNMLSDVPVEKIGEMETYLFEYLVATRAELLAAIRESGELSADSEAALKEAISACKTKFLAENNL